MELILKNVATKKIKQIKKLYGGENNKNKFDIHIWNQPLSSNNML